MSQQPPPVLETPLALAARILAPELHRLARRRVCIDADLSKRIAILFIPENDGDELACDQAALLSWASSLAGLLAPIAVTSVSVEMKGLCRRRAPAAPFDVRPLKRYLNEILEAEFAAGHDPGNISLFLTANAVFFTRNGGQLFRNLGEDWAKTNAEWFEGVLQIHFWLPHFAVSAHRLLALRRAWAELDPASTA